MSAFLARAVGAPGPTLVLDAATAPTEDAELLAYLGYLRRGLRAGALGDVLKLALVQSSAHPMFDLDYRFAQGMPVSADAFDLRGDCGHSILAAILAASRMGLIPPLAPGGKTRVNVVNNGDQVVCEVEAVGRGSARFTTYFMAAPGTRLNDLLTAGARSARLTVDGGRPVRGSLVRLGNPYLFVDAADLGVASDRALFADDPRLLRVLADLRGAAARALGWAPSGALPKVAAVGRFQHDRLAARALTVTGWHPSLALTGASCLATATAIPGTVPNLLWPEGERGRVTIQTPAGATEALCATSRDRGVAELLWTTIHGKHASLTGPVMLDGPAGAGEAAQIRLPGKDVPCLLTAL